MKCTNNLPAYRPEKNAIIITANIKYNAIIGPYIMAATRNDVIVAKITLGHVTKYLA